MGCEFFLKAAGGTRVQGIIQGGAARVSLALK